MFFLTRYRHERKAEKVIRSIPTGIDDVFDSNWEHFQQMVFLRSTPGINSPLSTLDKCEITPPAPKKSEASQEKDARAALYIAPQRALINPLTLNQIQVNERNVEIVLRNAQTSLGIQ